MLTRFELIAVGPDAVSFSVIGQKFDLKSTKVTLTAGNTYIIRCTTSSANQWATVTWATPRTSTYTESQTTYTGGIHGGKIFSKNMTVVASAIIHEDVVTCSTINTGVAEFKVERTLKMNIACEYD